jgi:hypothetical protein
VRQPPVQAAAHGLICAPFHHLNVVGHPDLDLGHLSIESPGQAVAACGPFTLDAATLDPKLGAFLAHLLHAGTTGPVATAHQV